MMYRVKKFFKRSALLFVYAIALSGGSYANECPVQEFKQYSEKLDKTKVESIDSLKENYIKTVSTQSKQCRSMLFGNFRHYYDQMTQAYIVSIEEKLNEKYPLSETKEKMYKEQLHEIGLIISQSEGMYYVEADSAWFLKEFDSSLSDEWKKFLKQNGYETKNSFAEDAVLLISFEELRKRVIFWENFLHEYPGFTEAGSVKETLSKYLSFYLSGIYGSLNFSHIPISSTDIRRSYENFLKQNTQSRYYEVVKIQYNIIKDNAFVIDENVSKKLDINYRKSEKEITGKTKG